MDPHKNSSGFVDRLKRKAESCRTSLTKDISIFKVPPKLRPINPVVYTPLMVSIGPFHHGKPELAAMEYHKLNYLHQFLQRVSGHRLLEDFAACIMNNEAPIRQSYADVLRDFSGSDDFCEMILVDSIFILELLKRDHEHCTSIPDEFDFLASRARPMYDIALDLILLENQVPFFALDELYRLAFGASDELLSLSIEYFSRRIQSFSLFEPDSNPKHFTDLVRQNILHGFTDKPQKSPNSAFSHHENPSLLGLIRKKLVKPIIAMANPQTRVMELPLTAVGSSRSTAAEEVESATLLYSATKLREAGVKFRAGKDSKSLLDIEFERGKLAIPPLEIDHCTELVYRNVMALEQCRYPNQTTVCYYVKLLDHLVNTAKDVDLLVEKKILQNQLGENQMAADVINKLCVHVGYSPVDPYETLIKEVNAYYQVPYNSWKATLKHEYFSTPWRIASAIAAFILLALAFTQTLIAILEYHG